MSKAVRTPILTGLELPKPTTPHDPGHLSKNEARIYDALRNARAPLHHGEIAARSRTSLTTTTKMLNKLWRRDLIQRTSEKGKTKWTTGRES